MSISVDSLRKELENVQDENVILESVTCLNNLLEDNEKKWEQGTDACKNLANVLRTASVRSPLGEANIIETLTTLLQSSPSVDFQLQSLRVLGNLCFDHEQNRKRVKDAGLISLVVPWFDCQQKDLIRTLCGFYLNSSMDYAPIQIEIAECGGAVRLVDLVRYDEEDDGTVTMAIKVLDCLVAEDTARKLLANPHIVKVYLDMIEAVYKSGEYMEELDNLENLADTLLQVIMDDDNLQNEIIELGKLNFLLEFLEKTDILINDKEEKDRLEEIRKTISKITIYATSTDSKMNELYNNKALLERFLKMAANENEVVHQCAAYILGNLARTDAHCIELVEKYNLSKLLLDLYQTTENATFQYAILGCLKHLCLPVPNKTKIGKDDCIRILTPTLDESKDMLKRNQFLTIGIIKLLCAGNYQNAVKVVEENTFSSVVSFIKRVDDVAAKSEATRVLTNLIKAIWVEKDNLELRNKVIEAHIIEPIIELVRTSTFPVLKNDGVMALTLIFSDPGSSSILDKALPLIIADPPVIDINEQQQNEDEPQQQQKPELRSFLQVLIDDICLDKVELPVQIKCNMCVLLLKVIESAKSVKDQENVISSIKSLGLERLENIQDNAELYKYSNTLAKALKQ
ncbi:armadillo-type protein [Pilaira anomala]|nr:armadillo-type protein [Pilaira anomala]